MRRLLLGPDGYIVRRRRDECALDRRGDDIRAGRKNGSGRPRNFAAYRSGLFRKRRLGAGTNTLGPGRHNVAFGSLADIGAQISDECEQIFRAYRETLPDDRRILLDRYRIVDAAIKVVGIGSVGRRCWIALLMSENNDPLFLQFKEAVESVLEPYAGKSAYSHHGQRVVIGQRLMQPVSDIFLGWVTAPNGRQFYVRQLHDAKIKPVVETFNAEMLDLYAMACGWALAHAHSKVSEISATISGYLGSSSDEFDEAMGKFALASADQVERDYAVFKDAVKKGEVPVNQES